MVSNAENFHEPEKQLDAKEITIMELVQELRALDNEKEKVLSFQNESKEKEMQVKALETVIAKGKDSIRKHEEKTQEMHEYLKPELKRNARKQLISVKSKKLEELETLNKEIQLKISQLENQERAIKFLPNAENRDELQIQLDAKERTIVELEKQLRAQKQETEIALDNEK